MGYETDIDNLIAKSFLNKLLQQTDPNFRFRRIEDSYTNPNGIRKYGTNIESAANIARIENDMALLNKSLGNGYVNFPYQNYEDAIDRKKDNNLAENMLNYAWFQKHRPDQNTVPTRNIYDSLDSQTNNLFNKLNRR